MEYGVSSSLLTHIALKESTGSSTILGDMKLICHSGPNKGKPVRAKGVVQITDCYHPEVTDEQAFDMNFSMRFLASNIKKGNCHEWSTCNQK